MFLLEALAIANPDQLDTSRPLQIGLLELGLEAAAEADRILTGGDFSREVVTTVRQFTEPVYWEIAHRTAGAAEVFGFPSKMEGKLPTAVEIALVRAIAASPPETHPLILAGDLEIAIGPEAAWVDFRRVVGAIQQPKAGSSLLFDGSTQVIISENSGELLNNVALTCLLNSFNTTPLKFRFLELYRVMEARFLQDIRAKLLAAFNTEPGAALNEAVDALKSEMNQITGLAETQQDAFEACWTALNAIKNNNRFAAALFRRLEKKGVGGGIKWKIGAALIYQIRCAIVHAGEKDMIFDNFPDGDFALEATLPCVERASLLLVGIDLS